MPLSRTLFVAITMASFLVVGCGDKPTDAECEDYLSHMIDLEVTAKNPEMKADHPKQKASVRKSIGAVVMKECQKTLPGEQVRCAIKASSMADVAKCEGED
jgi:hypothetical protein